MTSWNRGKENEEKGERELSDGDASNNLEGVARKVGGEIEQGIDNLGDTITGKQNDLQGKDQNIGNRAGDAVGDAGRNVERDARDTSQNAGDWVQDRKDDIQDATR